MVPARGRGDATFELLSPSDGTLELKFGDRPDLVLGAGQTGCSVHLDVHGVAATVRFVTDITCLDMLVAELAAA